MNCAPSHELALLKEGQASLFCGDNCDIKKFKLFKERPVHIEIEPTTEMAQVFYNMDPKSLFVRPLIINKTVKIEGRIEGADVYSGLTAKNTDHDKSASFSDIIAIPLSNKTGVLSPTIPPSQTHMRQDGSFKIDLLASMSYAVVLNPLGQRDRAPVHLNVEAVMHDGTFNLVAPKKPVTLSGRVICQDAPLIGEREEPLLHARVMQGTRLISSDSILKKDGSFILELSHPPISAENIPITLLVEPIDVEVGLPRIKRMLEIKDFSHNQDLGTIDLGNLGKPVSMTIQVHGSDDSTIGKAFLYLNAKIGSGEILIKRQLDDSGSTRFDRLFLGNYDIAVVPPFESKFAMKVVKTVNFDTTEDVLLSIDLQEREAFDAQILSPEGQPVGGAVIEFSRVGEVGLFATAEIYEDMLFKLTASTNDEGKVCHRRFGFTTSDKNECASLLLDEGRYLAHIIPPAGTELSHQWLTFDFPEQRTLTIQLEQPEILQGQVLSWDQTSPLRRAFITVYLAETNIHNQPQVIGNAITDDQGFFTAFVSAP